jgi:hypothetical protein
VSITSSYSIDYLAMSENPFQRAARAVKRPDYYALNDGSDSEAETDDRIMPVLKRPHIAHKSSQNQFIE